ncbi:p21-activated protein kinase-interacting protein 1-like [Copidosoma floridanum]|uniref:p21-activated protein kinase-interacting protein 1-like n=1 Tax=Copidosoma floridanum TaxID=29053 RepID=UPI0006C9B07F|nr:p21-activated protein kinase-interacting protein 1-like [Copidosoma floridanum]
MSPNLEVVVGTYEQFLLGYTVDDVVNKYKMEQSFAMHSHLASIRSVASSKHYLASAAADDTVCLYDLRSRAESGKLVHHNDTINSISFTPDGSHIMTASSDGSIGIVRCGNWQLEKHWLKPHKGSSVDTLAIHPTGKIALTTGHDGVLRTWNLVKGRQAYATNLVPRWKVDAKNISVLKWSPSGVSYLIAANNKIDIYSVETAGIEKEIDFETKVASVEYLNDEFIAIGLADGKICIFDLKNETKIEFQAHSARVKCLACNGELLVSASSSGEIKVWSFEKDKLTLLNEVNCSARISCMALTSCPYLKVKKSEVVEVEKEVAKNPDKSRLRQHVIIEEEDTKLVKNKRNRKNKRKSLENNNNTENVLQPKKLKVDLPKQVENKKRTASSEPIKKIKKKKTVTLNNNKRKNRVENTGVSTKKQKISKNTTGTAVMMKKKKKKTTS